MATWGEVDPDFKISEGALCNSRDITSVSLRRLHVDAGEVSSHYFAFRVQRFTKTIYSKELLKDQILLVKWQTKEIIFPRRCA
jgi:hypothetical protein